MVFFFLVFFFVRNDRVCYGTPACIIWRGACYLVFLKSCFFDVPFDHTDMCIHQMHVCVWNYNELAVDAHAY